MIDWVSALLSSWGSWVIRQRDGGILASSEGYTRRASAEQTAGRLASHMRSVRTVEV